MPGIQVEVATLNPILSSIRFSTSKRNIDLLGFYMKSNHKCVLNIISFFVLHYVFATKHNFCNFFSSIAIAISDFDYFLGFLNKPGVCYISLICIPPTHTLYVEYKWPTWQSSHLKFKPIVIHLFACHAKHTQGNAPSRSLCNGGVLDNCILETYQTHGSYVKRG
jgi:hypothetical protein